MDYRDKNNRSNDINTFSSEEKDRKEEDERRRQNSDFEDDEQKPSTGGYGDQHDEERIKESSNTSNFDLRSSSLEQERSERYGFDKENERNRSYDDYDRGFQDGMRHASRRYNERYWDSRKEERDIGVGNDYSGNEGSGYDRYDQGTGNRGSRRYESERPYRDTGRQQREPQKPDVDSGTNRDYPGMQGGYGDYKRHRTSSEEKWNEKDHRRARDEWNESPNDPWNDRSYGGASGHMRKTWGSDRPYGEDRGGEERSYEGNEHGSPNHDVNERANYERSRNYDTSGERSSNDRDNDTDADRHANLRKLRRERQQREYGDRDREW